ncbi:MAG TPA: hypothetical protein DCQ64_23770 [Candidatus Rokubacteria bacterium]|nr:hypothetical protein [Candidatus Rokubacteria bacterium]
MVTERGKPVAIMLPPATAREDRRIQTMLRKGEARWGDGKPKGARRPARIKGSSVAQAVLEARGSRT